MPLQFKHIQIKRILIIFWGRLGEVTLSTMLLQILKKKYKNAHITYIVGGDGAKILENEPHINKLVLANINVYRNLLKEGPYDLVMDLYGGKGSRLMAQVSGAKYGIFLERPCKDAGFKTRGIKLIRYKNHNVKDHFLNIARILGINIKDTDTFQPYLSVTKKEAQFAKRYLRKFNIAEDDFIIGLQPAGHSEKWPPFKYAQLGKELIKGFGAKVLIFQGPEEKPIANRVFSLMPRQAVLLPYFDIRRYLAILSRCKLFITNTGGPSHAAPALGVPTVIIMVNSEADYWIPRYKKSFYLPIRSKARLNHKAKMRLRRNLELTISVKRVMDFIR